ncbi:unnamed protein product [Paramecium octaurelia]|uniref:Uncharacterized protein n=1 Tax=Paramecium octaurelia TaxID=43137 RepID=A0A8S1SJR6_PAROT|nr:unnamed protein product [Paramecium octaurelia]
MLYENIMLYQLKKTGDIVSLFSKDQLLTFIVEGVPSLAWAYRYVLINDNLNTFDGIVQYLEQNQVAYAVYNGIGGKSQNQGVIMMRDPFNMYPTIGLNVSILSQTNHQQMP